jgi:hypothetical protein
VSLWSKSQVRTDDDDDHADGVRLRLKLRSCSSPGDIWARRANVEWYRQGKTDSPTLAILPVVYWSTRHILYWRVGLIINICDRNIYSQISFRKHHTKLLHGQKRTYWSWTSLKLDYMYNLYFCVTDHINPGPSTSLPVCPNLYSVIVSVKVQLPAK